MTVCSKLEDAVTGQAVVPMGRESSHASPKIKEALRGRIFVYLAYLDDSDTREKAEEWQVISAVLIPADSYTVLEFMSAFTVEDLMPEERRDAFEEFHASRLYGGYPPFEGIDQHIRLDAIRSLLGGLSLHGFKVAYGAVNLKSLHKGDFGSANPQDVAFRRCVLGAGEWIFDQVLAEMQQGKNGEQHTALFIMDECDQKSRATLQKSFRSLRPRFRLSSENDSNLPFVHDDIYFGDSKYSIGIQMADLCSYFIARHLAGDSETEHFYRIIEPQIISAVTAGVQ